MYNKTLGCLLGAAIGDAMGAATETMSASQILKQYGAPVKEFKAPPPYVPARGRRAGQITDAFSIPYFLLNEILEQDSQITRQTAKQALKKWGKSEYFEPFAGMTTRKAVKRLNDSEQMSDWEFAGHLGNKLFKGHYYALSSNGAACKAFPAGLLSRGELDAAIEYAVEISMSSHDDPLSISGACAVAAAVSEALKANRTVFNLVQAGLYGARRGEELARKRHDIWIYPGPSVKKRIDMAIEIALKAGDQTYILSQLREKIGNGPAIAETVPTVFGILIAEQGDAMESIYAGVGMGDETSAAASIAGAIAGCFHGETCFPQELCSQLEAENQLQLMQMAARLGGR